MSHTERDRKFRTKHQMKVRQKAKCCTSLEVLPVVTMVNSAFFRVVSQCSLVNIH